MEGLALHINPVEAGGQPAWVMYRAVIAKGGVMVAHDDLHAEAQANSLYIHVEIQP